MDDESHSVFAMGEDTTLCEIILVKKLPGRKKSILVVGNLRCPRSLIRCDMT
jgi:hypothetical protein